MSSSPPRSRDGGSSGAGHYRGGGRGGSVPEFQTGGRQNQQQPMRPYPPAHGLYQVGTQPMPYPHARAPPSHHTNSPPRTQQPPGGRYHHHASQQQQQQQQQVVLAHGGRYAGSRGRGGGGGRGGGSSSNSPSPQTRAPRGGAGVGGGRGGGSGRGHHGEGRYSSPPPTPASGVPWGFLPPFLPGSASLLEQLDQRLLIVLRDGRHLVGILRSFDQYSNMLLEDSSERRMFHSAKTCFYADVPLGLYVVRGDSMVLLGEVMDEDDLGDTGSSVMKKVSLEELHALQEAEGAEAEGAPDKPEAMGTSTGVAATADTVNWDFDTDLVV